MQIQSTYFYNNGIKPNFEGKVKLKRASLFDSSRICNFDVDHPKLDKLEIVSSKCKNKRNDISYDLKIVDKNQSCLAKEKILIDRKKNEIYGSYIETNEDYRGNSLGEILSMASIITMLENKMRKIKICTLPESLFFHSKYKFEPDITESNEAIKILNQIKKYGNEEYSEHAENLLREFWIRGNTSDYVYARINKLAKEFIKEHEPSKPHKGRIFDCWLCDMALTEENVFKNKDYFNGLFKKHGIDYEI